MTTVCLTFDFDAVSIWVSTFKQTTATPVSRGEYAARVGIVRILDLLKSQGVKATFFVPAHTAVSFPDAVKRIASEGHEIGVHGFCHESPVGLTQEEEKRLLLASIEKLRKILGATFALSGYRSPAWDLSDNTVRLLEDQGFLYDSSMMADDFKPYHPHASSIINDDGFSPGELSHLVEMPVAWELDDYPYFQFMVKPINPGLRNPREVHDIWKSEFDYCNRNVKAGVFTLTMHPEIIGRGPRIEMLSSLIDQMKAGDGVSFATLATAAEGFLKNV